MDKKLPNLPNEINPEVIEQLLKDRKALIAATQQSFFYFFYVYFLRHLKCPIAPFHFDLLKIAQDEEIKRAGVMTFRNSGKSTILNTAYALWAIMGIHQKKHVVIASQTQARAKDHLMNIRKEMEHNELLIENFGPFGDGEERWNTDALIIPKYEARISAISVEEGLRGLKEGPHRPSLILVDDIEDSNSVKTKEGRNKTFDWFTGELIPLGESDVKVIVLGNFLHKDSVLSRIEEKMEKKEMPGTFLRVPLVDEKNKIAWPGKFTSLEEIEKLKKGIGNELTWQRDFMLRAIPGDHQIIDSKRIRRYPKMPRLEGRYYRGTFIGIDPAGSKNKDADFTAMVAGSLFGEGEDMVVFIHPNPVNERLDFNEIKERAILLSKTTGASGCPATLEVEAVSTQKWLAQELDHAGMPVEEFKIGVADKEFRLTLASSMVHKGKVLFPKEGAEDLLQQLTGFGVEKYDDLADAFSLLILKIMEIKNQPEPRLTIF